MSPLECFKLYIPLKLHFTQKKFSVFENPKVKNTTLEIFEKRRDKKLFEKLSKRFSEPRECVRYYVSNFAYGNMNFLYEPGLGIENYNTWNKRRQSISHVFKTDLDYIILQKELNKIDINKLESEIFNLYINKEVTFESLVILNSYNSIINKLSKSDLKLVWEDEFLRLQKCERFIKFDKDKMAKLYDDYDNEIK